MSLPADAYSGMRLLAVHAHPDDESSKGAATSAMYSALGAEIMIATLTGGEAGDILNPALADSPAAQRDIAGLRRDEMAAAAAVLGASHQWVGFVDSGLPDGDFDELTPHGSFYKVPVDVAARPVVNIIRRFKPHVVTTYDELGGYPHPDHIHAHRVTMAAVEQAASIDSNPELGEPWQVSKVYYNQDLSPAKWLLIHELLLEQGFESPFADLVERIHKNGVSRETWMSTRIPCGSFQDKAKEALQKHATQIDPAGGFFTHARETARRNWPTEEFELAQDQTGRVLERGANFVETDLFAGLHRPDGTLIGEHDLENLVDTAEKGRQP